MGRKVFKNPDIYNIVAANIKKERIAAGITQQELADRTGYSHEYIRRIEAPNRTSGFTIESVYVISKALCIPIEVLFETKNNNNNNNDLSLKIWYNNVEEKIKMKNKEKSSKKKTKIILIIIGSLLILIGLFLFWFFNRKFDVTFKVNDTDEYVVKVKYNHKIKEKDIKTDKELGENFIGWYEVVSTENDKEVLAKDSYDFSTKIKEDVLLKATYKGQVETITITFDSKGGSEVDSITINKGAELTLPDNPTKNGYTFVTWELKDGTPIYNNIKLDEDTTLYANWKKNEEPKKEETKKEEPKKEETISLSLSRSIIHRNGYNTSKATAKVENASGDVTYSIDNNVCVSIDKTTGNLTANEAASGSGAKVNAWKNTCAVDGKTVKVTATLPSGKSASATLTIEKDLVLYASNTSVKRAEEIKAAGNGKVLPADANKRFYVDANQTVTWSAKANDVYGTCTPVSVTSKSDSYTGDLNAQCTDGNARNTYITATTTANQQITIQYYQNIN